MKPRKKPVRTFAHDDLLRRRAKVRPLIRHQRAVEGFAKNTTLVVIPSRLPLASELPEPVVVDVTP